MYKQINIEMCLINVTAVLRLKGSFRYNALYNIHIFDRSMIHKKKKKKKKATMKRWLLTRYTRKKQNQESCLFFKG